MVSVADDSVAASVYVVLYVAGSVDGEGAGRVSGYDWVVCVDGSGGVSVCSVGWIVSIPGAEECAGTSVVVRV